MTDCKKCPVDNDFITRFAKLEQRVEDGFATQKKDISILTETVNKALGNGLVKRIRRVEHTVWIFVGGITVLAFLIKELHLLG
jgi:hypothetical protein